MKRVSFLSNMILQPIKRELKEYECQFFDLDSIVPTLHSKVDSDYLVLLLEPRFFYDTFIDEEAFERINFLKALLKEFRKNNKAKILLSNIDDKPLGVDTTSIAKFRDDLNRLNVELESFKQVISDLEIVDIVSIAYEIGHKELYNEKNRYLFQSPFTKKGISALSKKIKEAINRFESKRKKVIVLDADNTLWGGILGEDGIDGIAIDENYPGIAYKRFQKILLKLKDSGLVLAMVSKNNFQDIKELFQKRKMPLSLDDFVSLRVNWLPKSQNIKDIADELNLGVDSFLFIDDNPFEIQEVKSAIPQISTLQADKDNPLNTIDELLNRADIQTIVITNEDRKKTQQYKSEKKRAEVFKEVSDIEEFIKSLNIKIEYWINNKKQLQRITQLINKTNQFNLTTRRYTEAEVEKMMEEDKVFSFKVTDNFGDMGIVGVVIVKNGHIDTFLLSCRVLGRGIEDRIMDIVIANTLELKSAEYIPSKKNMQVANLYEKLGFELEKESNDKKIYRFVGKEPKREYIEIIKGDE